MTRLAAILAGAAAATVLSAPAQAYDWGGGRCIGYGCARVLDDDGYRPVRQYRRVEEFEERPVRVIERRTTRRVYEEIDDDED